MPAKLGRRAARAVGQRGGSASTAVPVAYPQLLSISGCWRLTLPLRRPRIIIAPQLSIASQGCLWPGLPSCEPSSAAYRYRYIRRATATGRRSSSMSNADAATAAFQADKTASNAMPWQSFTPAAELDADKEYYCVATWGILSLTAAPAFWSRTTQIKSSIADLPRGQCVGVSVAVRTAWPFNFVAETLTVWHGRQHSTAFFRSDVHRQGMQALQGRVEFRAHRVWVKAEDLPVPGNASSTKQFWAAVKTGEQFRKVETESTTASGRCPAGGAAGACPAGGSAADGSGP